MKGDRKMASLSQIVAHAGDIADETVPLAKGTEYVNDAIAKINAKAKANFPFFNENDPQAEFPFPETWVRVMIVPFVAGRIKTKDSSQFEYTDMYAEFLNGLDDFMANYIIPEIYRSTDGMVYDPETGRWGLPTSDVFTVPPFPWGGRW
jgi:hypothetical protein